MGYPRNKLRCKRTTDEGMGNDGYDVYLGKEVVGSVWVGTGGWSVTATHQGKDIPLLSGWGGASTRRDAIEELADFLRKMGVEV